MKKILEKPKLLSRDEFRNSVFARDGDKCVMCGDPAQDAHHIIERRIFHDGGYYIDNGASLCGECHFEAEKTTVSVEQIREACGITRKILPEHLYPDQCYDKWGNPIIASGKRLRGELFYDESVQKVLTAANILHFFSEYVKYPRTYHLPWSPGLIRDDRQIETCSNFEGREVVVTVKLDGENTTMYRNYIHARSIDGRDHVSRSWVKNFHASIAHDLSHGWRICGENMYAQHSIKYHNLETYFYGFSMWENDKCFSWEETLQWFELLGITPVPVLYKGVWDEDLIKNLYTPEFNDCECEGYVVRLADSFSYGEFKHSVAKYVRADHVQTHDFWGRVTIPNQLQKKNREI